LFDKHGQIRVSNEFVLWSSVAELQAKYID